MPKKRELLSSLAVAPIMGRFSIDDALSLKMGMSTKGASLFFLFASCHA
jgi:hypothetical protein